MTNSDFRIQVGLFSHPKFIKLERKLGAEGALAYVKLLGHVATNKPDGVLSNMDDEDIAIAGDYKGDADVFVATLVAVRFVDVDAQNGVRSIHDWAEHNPWAAGAVTRSKKAQAAANARWGNDSGGTADKGTKPTLSNAPAPAEQSVPMQSAVPQTQDSNTNTMPVVCSEHDLALQQAPFSNAPLLSVSYPSPSQPIQTNPSVRPSPNPASGTAQTTNPPGPVQAPAEMQAATDGRTDGDMPDGTLAEAENAERVALDAQSAVRMRPEELLTAFKSSRYWPIWKKHILDVLKRGTNRKSSEAAYLKPTLLSILKNTEPLPGSIQTSVSERRTERDKAAENRVVTAPTPSDGKRPVSADWLPGVGENEAREMLNKAWEYLKSQGVTGIDDKRMVHTARKFWRDTNPAAPPADWEDKPNKPVVLMDGQGDPVASVVIKSIPWPPPALRTIVSGKSEVPANDEVAEPSPERREAIRAQLDQMKAELASDEKQKANAAVDYSAPNNLGDLGMGEEGGAPQGRTVLEVGKTK